MRRTSKSAPAAISSCEGSVSMRLHKGTKSGDQPSRSKRGGNTVLTAQAASPRAAHSDRFLDEHLGTDGVSLHRTRPSGGVASRSRPRGSEQQCQ
jgi:hypothetical protein